MSSLIERLPRYYQDSPPVAELERVLGLEAAALLDARDDTLAQLWVESATWGLATWERWCGLPVDGTRPYSQRRQRVLAKLRGQGTTTAEMIARVVASFGFDPEQITVTEHPADHAFVVAVSGFAEMPEGLEDVTAAVDEIKPAHLQWWFSFPQAQLTARAGIGTGLWRIRQTVLPAVPAEG